MSEKTPAICASRRLLARVITLLLVHCVTLCNTQADPGQPDPLIPRPLSLNDDEPAPVVSSTLPPTELRIIYPEESALVGQDFPNRIRLSAHHDVQVRGPARVTAKQVTQSGGSIPLSDYQYPRLPEHRQDLVDIRTQHPNQIPRNPFPALIPFRQPIAAIGETQNQMTYGYGFSDNPRALSANESSTGQDSFNTSYRFSSSPGSNVRILYQQDAGYGTTVSPYVIGNITIGALIGIITGVLTAAVLAVVIGIACYKRKNRAWRSTETDLKVLGSHYGSYWDDKTLPNFQFNDRIIWPGEPYEEMLALDNDAFLKSLEDLGRVSSRPTSKTNFEIEQQHDQRISTKV